MGYNGFPYSTIFDRQITDEEGNILFGKKPANVQDTVAIDRLNTMIQKQQTQITNQNTVINKLTDQVNKQQATIDNLQTLIDNSATQITNQQSAITQLESINNKTDTQIQNQETVIAKLNGDLAVKITGNTMEFYGSSTETKPTSGVKVGATYFEYDTTNTYMYTGTDWVAI